VCSGMHIASKSATGNWPTTQTLSEICLFWSLFVMRDKVPHYEK